MKYVIRWPVTGKYWTRGKSAPRWSSKLEEAVMFESREQARQEIDLHFISEWELDPVQDEKPVSFLYAPGEKNNKPMIKKYTIEWITNGNSYGFYRKDGDLSWAWGRPEDAFLFDTKDAASRLITHYGFVECQIVEIKIADKYADMLDAVRFEPSRRQIKI